jgi:uncharacterized protein YggE
MSDHHVRRILSPVLLALLIPAGAALADTPEISLSGEGQVRYMPDSVRLSFSINAEHPEADKALEQVRSTMGQWRDAIEDIRDELVDYSDASAHLYQRREPPRPVRDGNSQDQEPQTIAVASQTITFEIHDLDLLNPVLEKAQNLGMNYSLGQHQFFHSDEERLQRDALAAAIRNARERCRFAAAQLDMTCGEVKSLNLQSSGGGPVMMRMAESSAKADTVSEVGPREITATVQATFTME